MHTNNNKERKNKENVKGRKAKQGKARQGKARQGKASQQKDATRPRTSRKQLLSGPALVKPRGDFDSLISWRKRIEHHDEGSR